MDQETLHAVVISGRPGPLMVELESRLAGRLAITLRALPPMEDASTPAADGEILIIDFTSLHDSRQLAWAQDLAREHPCLSLIGDGVRPAAGRACGEGVAWPCSGETLAAVLRRLAHQAVPTLSLEKRLALRFNLVGESPAFLRTLEEVRKFSRCDAPVMLLGETGTGKEKIARSIHYLGVDEDRPFVAVNCGALPDTLVENELFGHVKGAYTDAREAQRGLVEQAAGGTLFLDEIEALSHKGQVALLRFLQEYEYRPIGADRGRTARLRLITASNESLEDLIGEGRFRRDLYYRINILSLRLPPLRERPEDVLRLAEHFLADYRQRYAQPGRFLSAPTREWLPRFDWPGNVRELENLLLRAFLLTDGDEIHIEPPHGWQRERRGGAPDRRFRHLYEHSFQEAKRLVVDSFERTYLQRLLRETRGNISQAARRAGKERRSFAKLLEKHGLSKQSFLAD